MVIRSSKSKKDRECNVQRKRTKGQSIMYKILHRTLKIEQQEPLLKPVWIQVLRKGKHALHHMWHPLHWFCNNPGDKSRTGLWWIVNNTRNQNVSSLQLSECFFSSSESECFFSSISWILSVVSNILWIVQDFITDNISADDFQ